MVNWIKRMCQRLLRITKHCGSIYTACKNWGVRKEDNYYVSFVTFNILLINFYVYCSGLGWTFGLADIITNPWDIIRYQFSHASSMHLFGNSLFLFFVGPACEQYLGHIKFLLFYLLCGCAAALGFLGIFPEDSIIGASGSISGIIAILPFVQPSLAGLMIASSIIGFYFIDNFQRFVEQISGFMFDNTAYLAHIIGAVAGLILFCLLKRK